MQWLRHFSVLVSLLGLSFSSLAGSINLGQAADYNVFVRQNFTVTGSDTEGKVAVGGNLVVQGQYNFGVMSTDKNAPEVVVGGNVSKTGAGSLVVHQGGEHQYGQLVYQGSMSGTLGGGTASKTSQLPVNFSTAFSHLDNLSATLAAQTTPSVQISRDSQNGILTFMPAKANADNVYVFNLTQEDYQNFNQIKVDNRYISKDALIVFNLSNPTGVTGPDWQQNRCTAGQTRCFELSNKHFSIGDMNNLGAGRNLIDQHLLFNFAGITDLKVTGSVFGSILAPKSNIVSTGGVIWGQVIANSWTSHGWPNGGAATQVNWSALKVPPGGAKVSSPAPLYLLLLLFVPLLARRRQAALNAQPAWA